MASLVSRLVACLVAVVAVLQLVHLVLLNKLETRRLTELQQLQQQQQQPPGISPLQGKDHPHLDSIINGPERLVQSGLDDAVVENEKLAARLSAEHEGTIVDSTGEFRIVFDIAGSRPTADNGANPRPFTKHQQNQPPPPPPQHQLQLEHLTDDFSIDEEAVSDTIDVTLVTQGDLTNARAYLVQLTERWQGPISLALFARNSSQVDASLEFIAQIRQCHDLSRQYVSFHLVFPLVEKSEVGKKSFKNRRKNLKVSSLLSSSSSSSSPSSTRQRFDPKVCQKFRDQIIKSKKQLESNNLNYDDRVYPVNLLRNVAKKRVMTEFSLVTDIDMLPSAGLRSKFQKFAQNKQLDKSDGDERKSVFVVPAFESKNGEAPRTKKELLNLIEKYQVRPFYFDLCWKCQVHTDYETWQREPESRTGDLTVLFEVLWKDPWEPFFIADNSLPSFDERFRQYGFNRLSQLCELHVAGYKFAVLNDAFLIHQGYKTLQSFHPGRSRDVENNRVNFRQFKFELKDKYPHSTRRCY